MTLTLACILIALSKSNAPELQATVPHSLAVWPLPKSDVSEPAKGVTRWHVQDKQGTVVDLVRFDFKENPKLQFEMYDQDEDDATPFDDRADYWPRGVGAVVRHLHDLGKGPILAAWNGMFFAYDNRLNPPHGMASHVGPTVLRGKFRYNVGNPRWSFGVSRGQFKAIYKPDKATLEREFDYASAGAQLLVRDGQPMSLEPGDAPDRAGARTFIDSMRTTRVSMGWSKDSDQFYMVVAAEPDAETVDKLPFGQPVGSGWNLDDLQRFWLAMGVWGAVNGDGGATGQFAFRQADGRYEVMPCPVAGLPGRLILGPDLSGAPPAGTLMTFYVREQR